MSSRFKQFFSKFDWKLPLHKNLDLLQKMLEKQQIDPASSQGLTAYELVCKQYLYTNTAASSSESLASQVKTSRQGLERKVTLTPFSIREGDLNRLIKKKRVREFLKFVRVLKEMSGGKEQRNRKRLNRQAAEYFFRISIARKFMSNLKQYSNQHKILGEQISTYLKMKQQALMEECFLAWKEQAFITQAERQARQEIQQKYAILSKRIFLNRLHLNLTFSAERKEFIQQQQIRLKQSIKKASGILLLNRLKKRNSAQQLYCCKTNQLQILRVKLFFIEFRKTIKKLFIYRQNKESQRIKTLKSYIFPRWFLRKLKASYEIRKVYFQKRGKIIFLNIFLPILRQNLQRKGYKHCWMNNLQLNLQFIDGRLKNESRRFHLSKLFNAFKERMKLEKQNIKRIVNLHHKVFLKQLIYNYKLSIISEKNSSNAQNVEAMRRKINGFNFLQEVYTEFNNAKTTQIVERTVNINRAKIFFASIKKNYRLSKYYQTKIDLFSQKRSIELLKAAFQGMRNATMTQKVNNRIVEQYQKYTNIVKLENIFKYLKEYTFCQKLLKKRIKNASRIRLSSYADIFFYNLRIQTYSQTKKKIVEEKIKRQQIALRRAVWRFMEWRKNVQSQRLLTSINSQIDKQYCLRFKWRYFYLLKAIAVRSRKEKELSASIKQKSIIATKRKCFDKIVTSLILCILYKQLECKLTIKLKKIGMESLKQLYFCKVDDCEDSIDDQQNQFTA